MIIYFENKIYFFYLNLKFLFYLLLSDNEYFDLVDYLKYGFFYVWEIDVLNVNSGV